MKTIRKIFLFIIILMINYSFGRSVNEWTQVTDTISINEWLTKAFKGLKTEHGIEAVISEVKNIICKTQLNNGLHIKLTFDLQEKKWECVLYKSVVETIRLKYEQCSEIPPEENTNNEDTKDKIDEKLNNDDDRPDFRNKDNHDMDEENQEKQPQEEQDDEGPPFAEARQ